MSFFVSLLQAFLHVLGNVGASVHLLHRHLRVRYRALRVHPASHDRFGYHELAGLRTGRLLRTGELVAWAEICESSFVVFFIVMCRGGVYFRTQ